jgi:hypothetical protein
MCNTTVCSPVRAQGPSWTKSHRYKISDAVELGLSKRLKVQVKIKRKENSYEIHDVDDPGRLSRQ